MKAYQLSVYEKALPDHLDWSGRFAAARTAGFDAMELSIDESDGRLARLYWGADERRTLFDQARSEGVALSSICLSGHRKYPMGSSDPATERKSMEIMARALDFACDMGIPVIQLAGYDVYYDPSTPDTVKRFSENLVRATQMAASAGVLLGFETMETPFMDTVQKAMAYVNQVNSPYLGVYPDLGNLTNASLLYGVGVPDDLMTGAGHLIATHIKETVPGKYREIPMGTGHVDFTATIQKAWALGVRRYVTEMWYVGQSQWPSDIAFAAQLARETIEKAQSVLG